MYVNLLVFRAYIHFTESKREGGGVLPKFADCAVIHRPFQIQLPSLAHSLPPCLVAFVFPSELCIALLWQLHINKANAHTHTHKETVQAAAHPVCVCGISCHCGCHQIYLKFDNMRQSQRESHRWRSCRWFAPRQCGVSLPSLFPSPCQSEMPSSEFKLP